MKDLIRKELEKEPRLKRLALSELLQHLILQSIYRHGAFRHLAFTGGTALRILYRVGRYSEDLDFSVVRPQGLRLRPLLEKVRKDLELQQLPAELRLEEEKTVARADLRFPGLLKALELAPLAEQRMTVKIEVDKRPPQGGRTEIALVTEPVSYTVAVFDLPSLFATKLHAILCRRFTKGRDYFDLAWFLGRGVKPNLTLLNAAIRQTEGKASKIQGGQLKDRLLRHLETVDFKRIRAEMERFLLRPDELRLLEPRAIRSLLRNY